MTQPTVTKALKEGG